MNIEEVNRHDANESEPEAARAGRRPGTPSVFHDLGLRCLAERVPNLRLKGFAAFAKELLLAEGWHPDDVVEADLPGLRPDAYAVDAAAATITLYEVEHSNPVDANKMTRVVEWWWALDDVYWTLRLITVDCQGREKIEIDPLLWEMAYLDTLAGRTP
jgi:hypothetical protein